MESIKANENENAYAPLEFSVRLPIFAETVDAGEGIPKIVIHEIRKMEFIRSLGGVVLVVSVTHVYVVLRIEN